MGFFSFLVFHLGFLSIYVCSSSFSSLLCLVKRLSPEIVFCEAQQKHRKERLSFLQRSKTYGAEVEGGTALGGNEKAPEN